MKKLFAIALSALLISTAQAQEPPKPVAPVIEKQKFYKYAHNDAEYSVMLPEAPQVETIWGDSELIPYLENPPKDGNLGEFAVLRRMDMETDDIFDVRITFLKTDDAFLASLTDEKIQGLLDKDMRGATLNERKYSFSTGANPKLKWATVTGFSVDKNNHAYFKAEHFLTGLQTILVIRVQYSVQNEKYGEYYQQLVDTIQYHPL